MAVNYLPSMPQAHSHSQPMCGRIILDLIHLTMYVPLGKVFFKKKYADNTYRQSFLFLNKHCHAIWQCRNHSSQVGGTTFTYIVVYGPTYVVVLLIVYEHASNPRIYVGNSCYFYVRSTAGFNWASLHPA